MNSRHLLNPIGTALDYSLKGFLDSPVLSLPSMSSHKFRISMSRSTCRWLSGIFDDSVVLDTRNNEFFSHGKRSFLRSLTIHPYSATLHTGVGPLYEARRDTTNAYC